MTNTGKIARLPRHIRIELNQRLADRHAGTRLVKWLNRLPEVQAVLARDFGGRPINCRNLREWKNRGFQDWQLRDSLITRAFAQQPVEPSPQGARTGNLTLKQERNLELLTASRHGKIARLPAALRDVLNYHLWNGEKGSRLVKWLNGLPAVQALLIRDFAGRPINNVNLTKWKAGGYRDWHLQHEIAEKRHALSRQATATANLTLDNMTNRNQTGNQAPERVI
jgi:hypothetical protein